MKLSTGDQVVKLQEKRNLFLSLVRKYPGISRKECAQIMRVSTFYASKLVPELIELGMIVEMENDDHAIGRGRPCKPLHINPDYEYYAGIDMEARVWRFVIVDFQGNSVFSVNKPFQVCRNRDEYLAQLEQLLLNAVENAGDIWSKVKAIGISAPGFLDRESGIVENYEILPEFKKIPLLDFYRLITHKHAYIRHNMYNLATYDLLKRPAAATLSVMHVAIRSGVAGVLSLNGTIYEGSSNMAGEIGLSLLADHKTLQEQTGLSALQRKLPELPQEFWAGNPDVIEKEMRKKHTRKIIQESLRLTAIFLANITAFIDPDELIVYSTLFAEPNKLWEILVREFDLCRRTQGFSKDIIRRSGSSEFCEAIGAAIFAIENSYQT